MYRAIIREADALLTVFTTVQIGLYTLSIRIADALLIGHCWERSEQRCLAGRYFIQRYKRCAVLYFEIQKKIIYLNFLY